MQEDIPRWYHLFWDRRRKGLMIRVHRFFLENHEFRDYNPYFKGLYDKPSFLPLFDKYESRLGQQYFGINDSISLIERDEEWMTYQIKIPSVVHWSNFVCTRCEGTRKRQPEEHYDEDCYWCNGTGKEKNLDYIQISEVCFSLSIFLRALEFPLDDKEIKTPYKQLFTLSSISRAEAHGHSVGGYASPEFERFLESFSTSPEVCVEFPTAVSVMKEVHERMFCESRKFTRFGCYTRGGQIVLDCPGDACQIHTEGNRSVGSGRGEGITCHNLDNSMEQLTLLSGMAEISSLYDDWFDSTLQGRMCRFRDLTKKAYRLLFSDC